MLIFHQHHVALRNKYREKLLLWNINLTSILKLLIHMMPQTNTDFRHSPCTLCTIASSCCILYWVESAPLPITHDNITLVMQSAV